MQAAPSVVPLLSLSPAALAEKLGGRDRAARVYALLRAGNDPFAGAQLGREATARLEASCAPSRVEIDERVVAEDGTTKLRLRFGEGPSVELVLIPSPGRTTACLSTQAGCKRGCRFCLTATMGLERSLAADEIAVQAVIAQQMVRAQGLPALRNLVFMGMGEPLDNLGNLSRALELITSGQGLGFGPRHVTVSTVGPSPEALLEAARLPCALAWSLHSADDELRRSLIPGAGARVAALRDALAHGLASVGRPLFVEMTLIHGLNDDLRSADLALELFRAFPVEVRFNLLPMNPIDSPELGPARPDRVLAFRDRIRAGGRFCCVREARGSAARSACGQLVTLSRDRVVTKP